MSSVKKKLLFVDDERDILDGLERMLYDMCDEWDMVFVDSGAQALICMEKEHFDGVISDMRMPGMDGAELLFEIKRLYPETIRFILSGHSDNESTIRAANLAHQFLNKPCDPGELQNQLKHAITLRTMLYNDKIKTLVTSLNVLPSLPEYYEELVEEVQSPEPSIKTVGSIISKDVAMTAKVLQLVNSGFFGLHNEITDITQAITLLGINTLKALVMVAHAFSVRADCPLPGSFSLRDLSSHCLFVGTCAKCIMEDLTDNEAEIEESFTAGLLHDIGKLILAMNRPVEYESVYEDVREGRISAMDGERQVFGSTHCDVGAYLLGLWGLPDNIIEAVVYHHSPHLCERRSISALLLFTLPMHLSGKMKPV